MGQSTGIGDWGDYLIASGGRDLRGFPVKLPSASTFCLLVMDDHIDLLGGLVDFLDVVVGLAAAFMDWRRGLGTSQAALDACQCVPCKG
jgi:hypothetical protein